MTDSIVWRRLDVSGHDACRLVPRGTGWALEGTVVFQDRGSACLRYEAVADAQWRCRSARVTGWAGTRDINITITRDRDGWRFDGQPVFGVEDCLDVDFGFTPATNLFQLRRIALKVGESAEVPVAWFDAGEPSPRRISQRYERRSEAAYWYESPSFSYAAELLIDANGFVREYPGLWTKER